MAHKAALWPQQAHVYTSASVPPPHTHNTQRERQNNVNKAKKEKRKGVIGKMYVEPQWYPSLTVTCVAQCWLTLSYDGS